LYQLQVHARAVTELRDRADTDPETLRAIAMVVGAHATLDQVVRWGLAATPEHMVHDVVVQDEFTHDVVVPWSDERFLVYDTT
jgi:hypothetical protein